MLCYVVMPDHLHWLMVLHTGKLPDAVRLLKRRSARAIGQAVWQVNYFDHAVRKDEDMRSRKMTCLRNFERLERDDSRQYRCLSAFPVRRLAEISPNTARSLLEGESCQD